MTDDDVTAAAPPTAGCVIVGVSLVVIVPDAEALAVYVMPTVISLVVVGHRAVQRYVLTAESDVNVCAVPPATLTVYSAETAVP